MSIYLFKNKKLLKELDKSDKEKLALFIRFFFNTISKEEYNRVYDNIHKIKTKNLVIRMFNYFGIGLANVATSALIEITSATIRKSLGLNELESDPSQVEYFQKISEVKNDRLPTSEEISQTKENLKQILDEVLLLIGKVGFRCTTVLFDKIDEYQALNQDITRISNFTIEILSDTELLLNEKLAIGFSLWSELKSELEGTVRFDKFGTIDVRWKSTDLVPLINKRLSHFSKNEKITLENLILNKLDITNLIDVSNKSPRDLISALSEIYQVQANTNMHSNHFESACVTEGLIKFCMCYDYDSMTPSKQGRNQEVKAMINRLLKVKLTYFTMRQLTNTFNQNNSQSEGQIKTMLKYKLIKEDDILGDNNEKYYDVLDPKVVFLIKRGINEIE